MFVMQGLLLLAETAKDHEAQVVRPFIILYALQTGGEFFGLGKQFLVACQTIALPERAGEESARPVLGFHDLELGHQRPRKSRQRVELGGGLLQLEAGDIDSAFHGSDFRVAPGRTGGQREEGQKTQNREKIFSHKMVQV